MSTTRVLIVEHTPWARRRLSEILGRDPTVTVVAATASTHEAQRVLRSLRPDVIALDMDLPAEERSTFLEILGAIHPTPVVMVSTLDSAAAGLTLEALERGAVSYVPKPTPSAELAHLIIREVKIAAQATVPQPGPTLLT
ncbi:MAG: response regulator, partial [Myxococcota bacterium]